MSVLEEYKIPLKSNLSLTGAERAINCVAWERSGARVLTGSADHVLRMYDFGGMTGDHKPFHEFKVAEGQSVQCIAFNPSGKQFVATTADAKPAVYDKNGNFIIRFIKGDPYILDNTKTVGHTNTVCSAVWHPSQENIILTASLDGCCRIWDLNGEKSFDELKSAKCIRPKNSKGLKVGVTACCYNTKGNSIALGCADGSIHIFDERIKYSRANQSNYACHSDRIVDLRYHSSGQIITSRGMDNTICLWDCRSIKTPLKRLTNITTYGLGCNVAYSPNSALFCTCQPRNPESSEKSHLLLYDVFAPTLQPLYAYEFEDSVIPFSCVWHEGLNQIAVGCKSGTTLIMYDKSMSVRGAVMVEGRKNAKKKEMQFGDLNKTAYAPDANDDDIKDNRDDPRKRDNRPGIKNPNIGIYQNLLHNGGSGIYERNDVSAPVTGVPVVSSVIGKGLADIEEITGIDQKELHMDPREAIVRHAEDTSPDMQSEYFNKLFKKNQPVPILAKRTLEADIDAESERAKRRATSSM